MCGGSEPDTDYNTPDRGLSPRVRGKLRLPAFRLPASRSIPACAGEAIGGKAVNGAGRVYPRVCGGSVIVAAMV